MNGLQQTIKKIFFALIRFELGTELSQEIKNLITIDLLPTLFKLAKRHDLAHLIGDALDENRLLPENSEVKKHFLQERNMAVYRYEQIQYEFEEICDTLEKARIPFIPLKGAVIRDLYPQPWMRTCCDIDILVKENDLKHAVEILQAKLKYRCGDKGIHDVSLFSEGGVHLELHYKLASKRDCWFDILDNVWDYTKNHNKNRYLLTKEMFYFYHIAHMAGHFQFGGCGVRSFLDLYLLRQHNQYNQEDLLTLLNRGGLAAFNDAVCAVSEYWFGGGLKTNLVESIENYILYAGMYGDMKNRVAVAKAKKCGWKLLWPRIFLPYNKLKFHYPQLQKCPILYPFYIIKRWFKLLKKENREKALREIDETMRGDVEKQEHIAQLIKDLNL